MYLEDAEQTPEAKAHDQYASLWAIKGTRAPPPPRDPTAIIPYNIMKNLIRFNNDAGAKAILAANQDVNTLPELFIWGEVDQYWNVKNGGIGTPEDAMKAFGGKYDTWFGSNEFKGQSTGERVPRAFPCSGVHLSRVLLFSLSLVSDFVKWKVRIPPWDDRMKNMFAKLQSTKGWPYIAITVDGPERPAYSDKIDAATVREMISGIPHVKPPPPTPIDQLPSPFVPAANNNNWGSGPPPRFLAIESKATGAACAYGAQRGTCMEKSQCRGTARAGLCAGTASIQVK
jgi:hypothetical protein